MNPVVIVPTFVSSKRRREGSVLTTYDHTTPINEPGELPRLLESLQHVRGIGAVIVLVVADRSIEGQAVDKVQAVVSRYPSLSALVVGAPEMDLLYQRMEQLGLGKLHKEIGLASYGAIRNTGLVLANVFGFDSVVFLDDDEVVDDAAFLQKAMYGLGKLTKKGIPILAKTGFYFNSEGSYLSKSQDKWYNHFWQQGKAFNHWISKAMRGPRLSRSNHVCGGCLALHKEAYKRLSFDPWIARGEDLDYMLDLRMYGSDIWFDNHWNLKHLPPASASEGTRFRQDIFRWLYEYRKMEFSQTQIDLLQVKPSSLEPYPGPFLEPGIKRRIRITAFLRSLARPDKRAYRLAARAASTEATTYADRNCAKYFEFQFIWPEVMGRLENDQILCDAILQSCGQRAADLYPEVMPGQNAMAGEGGQARAGARPGAARVASEALGAGAGAGVAGAGVAGAQRGAGVPGVPGAAGLGANAGAGGIDPGLTSEIRLNIEE